jgi:hypothetical protein
MRAEQQTVARLVNLARQGQVDAVVGSLSLLGYADPAQRERLRRILGTLIDATSTMLLQHAEPAAETGMFAVDLTDSDGSTVDIDELEPPVRATIRALLASVNGCPEDAADQVTLAVAGELRATAEVVVMALRWAVNAVESCAESGVPVPDWLHAAG